GRGPAGTVVAGPARAGAAPVATGRAGPASRDCPATAGDARTGDTPSTNPNRQPVNYRLPEPGPPPGAPVHGTVEWRGVGRGRSAGLVRVGRRGGVVVSDGRRLMGARLVGRQREMARIRACVDAVRGGGTAVLELVGDPGIGKSRLLGEAEQVAGQAGLEVVTGSASQFERELPFAVFGRLFDLLGEPAVAVGGDPGSPVSPADAGNPSSPGKLVGPGGPVSLAVAGSA